LINYHNLVRNADDYAPEVQQTITETIRHAFAVIRSNYGSITHYLEKELHLTNKKRERLKGILLY
jgi:protein tyrosine/serine phosphatase